MVLRLHEKEARLLIKICEFNEMYLHEHNIGLEDLLLYSDFLKHECKDFLIRLRKEDIE